MRIDRFRIGIIAGLFVVLAGVTASILDKQSILGGRRVLFETAPVDPRALLMGDYMQLAYKESRESKLTGLARSGYVVLRIDDDGVGHIDRAHADEPLAGNEVKVAYRLAPRWRGGSETDVIVAPDRFYFSEGSAERYGLARYAILRIDTDGRLLLVGLADEKRQEIPAVAP